MADFLIRLRIIYGVCGVYIIYVVCGNDFSITHILIIFDEKNILSLAPNSLARSDLVQMGRKAVTGNDVKLGSLNTAANPVTDSRQTHYTLMFTHKSRVKKYCFF